MTVSPARVELLRAVARLDAERHYWRHESEGTCEPEEITATLGVIQEDLNAALDALENDSRDSELVQWALDNGHITRWEGDPNEWVIGCERFISPTPDLKNLGDACDSARQMLIEFKDASSFTGSLKRINRKHVQAAQELEASPPAPAPVALSRRTDFENAPDERWVIAWRKKDNIPLVGVVHYRIRTFQGLHVQLDISELAEWCDCIPE